jgi:hypothetical protein
MTPRQPRAAALPAAAFVAGVVWAGLLFLCAVTLVGVAGRARAQSSARPAILTGPVTLTLRAPSGPEGTPRQEGVTALPSGSALLTELLNQVEARASAEEELGPAAPGQILAEGAQLRTAAGSAARLDLDDGAILRLGQDATLTLAAIAARGGSPGTALELDTGRLSLLLRGRPVEVRTPLGSTIFHGEFAAIEVLAGGQTLVIDCFRGPCAFQGEAYGEVVSHLMRLTIRAGSAQAEVQDLSPAEVEAFVSLNPEAEALRTLLNTTESPTIQLFGTATPAAPETQAPGFTPLPTQPPSGYPVPGATLAPTAAQAPTASPTLFSAPSTGTPPTPTLEAGTLAVTGTPPTATLQTGTPGTASPSPTGPTPTPSATGGLASPTGTQLFGPYP